MSVRGEKRWHLTTIRKSNGHAWIVCVSIDIHQERQLRFEAEQQRARNENAEKMALLGEMSSGIAHEINNPLTIIRGKAQQIERLTARGAIEPENLMKDAAIIYTTVDRIAKIIRGLKTFARDGGGDPFVHQSISAIVDDTLSLCQSRFQSSGIHVYTDPISETLLLECRPTQISQVLLNLLNNALDAVAGLDEKWVRISISSLEDKIQIRVIDSGKGIPAELREKITHPFFTTKEVGKGTGLGLSISLGIARAHKGNLEVDSSSKNTCFLLELPKRQELFAGQSNQ